MQLLFFTKKKQLFPRKKKYIFGFRFYRTLAVFDLRLDILALRTYLVKHIKVAWSLITLGKIIVNGFSFTRFYVLKPGDFLQRIYTRLPMNRFLRKKINFLKTMYFFKFRCFYSFGFKQLSSTLTEEQAKKKALKKALFSNFKTPIFKTKHNPKGVILDE